MFTAAKTAALAVGSVRLQAAITINVAARHHDWIDEQLQTDGTLEALLVHNVCDLISLHSFFEV